jgi:colanic acid/amylovoran biosynthesis glycosyltransferase
MKKLNDIGIVLPSIPAYSETFFHNKINGLLEFGYSVKLFVAHKSKNGHPEKWRVYGQPRFNQPTPFLISKMAWRIINTLILKPNNVMRFWRLEKKDQIPFKKRIENLYINSHILVHRLDWLHFGFATMTVRRENVANAIGAKMAISLRGYDINTFPLKNHGCYQTVWKKVDKIHSISDNLYKKANLMGLSKEVPWQKITPATNVEKSKYKIFGLPVKNDLRILTIGRLTWIKGYEYALSAMKLLKNQGIHFQYTIVGKGEDWERLHFARYQLGLEQEVSFTGKVSHEKIPKLMQFHDIYLQPSVQEGFCNAVLEAQAAGMLCVVTDAEGLAENVLHEQTGWVVPKRDPRAIAEKIINLSYLSNENLKRIQKNAVNRVAEEFRIEKQIEQFIEFYK